MKPYWQSSDGRLVIYHGDAREVIPSLDKVGLVLTDPPYAIGAGRGEWSATAAVAIGLHEAARRVIKGGALLAFTTTSGRGIEFTQGAIGRTLPFNRLLTWLKVGGRSRALSPWEWDSVAIMLFGRAPATRSGSASVFTSQAEYARTSDHPAELPEGLADWLYAPFDADGLTVLDPFMGSGRLLEPAIRSGRRAIGIEISEAYCEQAARRLEDPPMLAAMRPEQADLFTAALTETAP